MLNFWRLLNDCLASGVPASPTGDEEIPGKWRLVTGHANVDLVFGSFMLRVEWSRNSHGGNSVCWVTYLSLIKYYSSVRREYTFLPVMFGLWEGKSGG